MAGKHDQRTFRRPTYRGLPLSTLVGRPLAAAIRANEHMAREQVRFLMKTCFRRVGDVHEPITITMTISRLVPPDGSEAVSSPDRRFTTEFQLPLITLLPITSLAVEELSLDFAVEVHSHCRDQTADTRDPLAMAVLCTATRNGELTGSIAASPPPCIKGLGRPGHGGVGSSQPCPHIQISIAAGSLPLPIGVTSLLDAYSKATHPCEHRPNNRKNRQRR